MIKLVIRWSFLGKTSDPFLGPSQRSFVLVPCVRKGQCPQYKTQT